MRVMGVCSFVVFRAPERISLLLLHYICSLGILRIRAFIFTADYGLISDIALPFRLFEKEMEVVKEDSNPAASPPTIVNADAPDEEVDEQKAKAELKKSTDESKRHKGIYKNY